VQRSPPSPGSAEATQAKRFEDARAALVDALFRKARALCTALPAAVRGLEVPAGETAALDDFAATTTQLWQWGKQKDVK